jgi:hypothetical protein
MLPSESRTSIVSPSIISTTVAVCVCVVRKSDSVDIGVEVEVEFGVVAVGANPCPHPASRIITARRAACRIYHQLQIIE